MKKYSRRQIIQAGLGTSVVAAALFSARRAAEADTSNPATSPLRLDASVPQPAPQAGVLHMGTARMPDGRTLGADSSSLLLNGKPWMPVMGEMQYSRYPETEWAEALRRMKAGGIDIVSTYVFWIHQEEVQGQWDWTGRRNLHGFLQAVQQAGLSTVVRCGPWCHGEVRNGGFPDWLLADAKTQGYKTRTTDERFLAHVRPLYTQIAAQMNGLLWKDGGPVMGIQCDNEFRGPAEYLIALKSVAQTAGLDVPLYTKTAWPALSTPLPQGEMLPMFGVYAEGFWDRVLTPMPATYGDGFLFLPARSAGSGTIGTDQLGKPRTPAGDDVGSYPYCCCEIGGGMMTSYHRRIHMYPQDVLSTGLVKVGSGNNLQGYYMYQGGVNPEGKLTDLEETQASGGYNDLPIKTYDFQAPLGEFGQLRPHYHLLRRMHLFLRDWGPQLATMPARLPGVTPAGSKDTDTLRWSARTDGTQGFVFVNNYQRDQPMPAKPNVQFGVQLINGPLTFPAAPVTIPADSTFFWPFNMGLGGATLIHATAQPVCQVADGNTTYIVFAQTPNVPTEFVFDDKNLTVSSASGAVTRNGGSIHVAALKPGTGPAVQIKTSNGKQISLILLDDAQSLTCWKGTLHGKEHIFLTPADLTLTGDTLNLRSDDYSALTVAILPNPTALTVGGKKVAATADGLFHRYSIPLPVIILRPQSVATAEPVRSAGLPRTIPIGAEHVATQPTDADFDDAAVWRLHIPAGLDDVLLNIHYTGDVARLYLNGKFIDDNFYNGRPFEFGLKRYAPDIYSGELLLKILPLRKDAPIYIQKESLPDFGAADTALTLASIDVIERREASFGVGA